MTPPVRAALFDLDGTLVDSLPTIAEAMSEAARAHGIDAHPEEIVPLIGAPMNVLVEEAYGASPALADRVNAEYLRRYHDTYIQRTPPHEGAEALLRSLHEAGVALAIVTNKSDEGARLMTAIQGWDDLFHVVHGRNSGAAKPHPEAALAVLRKLEIAPRDAAFVGDTEFDMNCARTAGVRVVVGLEGSRSGTRLRTEGATHVVRSLHEVADILLGAEVAG